MEGLFIILPFIVIAIVFRLIAGGMDHDRIKQYVADRGGQLQDLSWTPLGPGWFGEKSDRIYCVLYTDQDGNKHEAHCKTSMWTGVYFTQDRIVKYAKEHQPNHTSKESQLEAENQKLREELQRLKKQ